MLSLTLPVVVAGNAIAKVFEFVNVVLITVSVAFLCVCVPPFAGAGIVYASYLPLKELAS